jgi:YaiO family outer membrane protein
VRVAPGSGNGRCPAATLGRLYPDYRIGAELNQSLPRAFEVSVGVRRLAFHRPVNLNVKALTKYLGSWMVTARVFHVPDDRSPTTSGRGIVRRHFGADGRSFVGVHYGRGRNLEDLRTIDQVALLDAQTGGVSIDTLVSRRVRVMIGGEASLSDRPAGGSLWQYTVSAGLGWGF